MSTSLWHPCLLSCLHISMHGHMRTQVHHYASPIKWRLLLLLRRRLKYSAMVTTFPESNPSPLQCGWLRDVISHQYRTWELLSHSKRHDLRWHSWRSEGEGELRQELCLSLKKTRFSASTKGLFWFRRRVPSKPAHLLRLIHCFHRRRFNVERVPLACVCVVRAEYTFLSFISFYHQKVFGLPFWYISQMRQFI